ncbi:hypothetical protein BH10PAT3_BH10PAT3_7270 [soil metagenome]
MRNLELSIDGNNTAAAIRDAVIEAEPEVCHGCTYAFDHSYETGQYAKNTGLDPEAAAKLAWGYIGACCRSEIGVELIEPDTAPSESVQKVLVSA